MTHAITLGLGGVLAMSGLIESAWLFRVEDWDRTLHRAAICVALLALTGAYVGTAIRKDTTRRALPFFAVSYIILGVVLDDAWWLLWKDEPTAGDYVALVARIVGVVGAVVLLALNAYRASRARPVPSS
jgi:hypothetical protein